MSDLFKKLDEVIDEDGSDTPRRSSAAGPAESNPRARMARGRRAALFASSRFHRYVEDKIVPRYKGLFSIRKIDSHEAYDSPAFGRLSPSAEHTLSQVTFKDINHLWVRFSAIILSNEFEMETAFLRRATGAETQKTLVPLDAHIKEGKVDWEAVFEETFSHFIDWYSQQK